LQKPTSTKDTPRAPEPTEPCRVAPDCVLTNVHAAEP